MKHELIFSLQSWRKQIIQMDVKIHLVIVWRARCCLAVNQHYWIVCLWCASMRKPKGQSIGPRCISLPKPPTLTQGSTGMNKPISGLDSILNFIHCLSTCVWKRFPSSPWNNFVVTFLASCYCGACGSTWSVTETHPWFSAAQQAALCDSSRPLCHQRTHPEQKESGKGQQIHHSPSAQTGHHKNYSLFK